MKREGWQHGVLMVRKPSLNLADRSANSDTGSFYMKAPSRPSNRSKQTVKCQRPRCAECHSLPMSKSRDKAKGAHKLKSCNVKLNHKLVSWRVVDDRRWPKFSGASASDLLGQLSGCYWNEEDDHEDEVEEQGDQFLECADFDVGGCSDGKEDEEDFKEDEDEEDDMGFCEVGFITEYLEREDWCMVYEI
ncbi:uncharacterized protein LOC110018812 [Phalaenopsis equestris]|uniref:uncharacterized protein LOC110018812 n=1 Tax=Phalaenopsis equestris TaxID=78828 RepID=UPI0009E28737|nr:uncharacterized protein LOC110018812 [Phalaenopsis equestris]